MDNVALPLLLGRHDRAASRRSALGWLERLGALDLADATPGELSGGEAQRVAVAGALVTGAKVVLADEPTGALDSEGGDEVLELFRRLHSGGQTILLVTHDQPVADAAQRVVRMKDGRVVDHGGRDPIVDDTGDSEPVGATA